MKKVIDGLRYNTSTAIEVATHTSHLSRSDFGWYAETLYRTPRGNWFLHGEGNAASPWSQPEGNGRGPGEDIRPIPRESARTWLEDEGELDALEQYFGEEIEDA
jgi:hypothetical protein